MDSLEQRLHTLIGPRSIVHEWADRLAINNILEI
jgi:hypothetical protein